MTTTAPLNNELTDQWLQELVDRELVIKICPSASGDANWLGAVVCVRPRFIIVREADNFREDGFCIIPRNRIARVERGLDLVFFQKVMESEGTFRSVEMPGWMKKPTLSALVKAISRERRVIGVNTETETDDLFLLGIVEETTREGFYLHYVTPSGKWEPKLDYVRWRAVKTIQCMDYYSEMFAKYAPPPGPKTAKSKVARRVATK